ncbi:MAG: hypothetical protein ACREVX_06860 [Clostridium sp.]
MILLNGNLSQEKIYLDRQSQMISQIKRYYDRYVENYKEDE